MTIQFNCPNCDALIAFPDKHARKRARCLTCGQIFIIPAKDGEKPKRIEPEIQKEEPVPGFYRALFIDSWKLFVGPENSTSLAFVVAAVCFRFFLGAGICCVNYISFVVVWGWLLGFYLNIVYETAYDIDNLPEIYLGTSITFLLYIIKPLLIFLFAMAVVQVPFIVAFVILRSPDLAAQDSWRAEIVLHALLALGLFLFPVAVLTMAVGKDFTLLRPDYLLAPIVRAFKPYLAVGGLLIAAGVLEMQTQQYVGQNFLAASGHLMLNLAVQVVAIMAMRSIGLFYRHYSCYFAW
jgi:ribosomal protein S27E